jgi:hypothetical protein
MPFRTISILFVIYKHFSKMRIEGPLERPSGDWSKESTCQQTRDAAHAKGRQRTEHAENRKIVDWLKYHWEISGRQMSSEDNPELTVV